MIALESIDWKVVVAIGKFVLLGLVDLGVLIWLFVRKLKQTDGDDTGFAVFRWLVAGNALMMLFWVAIPLTISGNPVGVIFGVGGMAICGILIALGITPSVVGGAVGFFTGAIDGSSEPQKKEALYSVALAKRNRNEPGEAIEEIREQLLEFPYDFEGMMLMAEIQAHDLKNLPAAKGTMETLLEFGKFPKARKAYVLTTMADWELELGKNPKGARAAFRRIVEMFPDSEISRKAELRMLRLPTREDIADRERTHVHTLPSRRSEEQREAAVSASGGDPSAEARELTERLTRHPEDDEARERLATIYARHYRRVDMAADQLEQLIRDPRQPRDETVRRLHQLAEFHLSFALDGDAARACLQRIVELFPGTPAAELAQNEMRTLPSTESLRRRSKAVPMVEAEKDLGLKRRPPKEWT